MRSVRVSGGGGGQGEREVSFGMQADGEGHADRARTKPLPKPWVEPSILCKVVKATPAAVARLQGSMVQPLLVQVPFVTFLSTFFPSKAFEASTACMALYCTFLCKWEQSRSSKGC